MFSRARSPSTRLAALAVACALALSAAAASAPALAGETRAEAAAELLAARADEAISSIVQSNCLGRDEPRPFTSTFFGLPEGEPHFGDHDRRRLNRLVGRALQATDLLPHVDESNTFGALAGVLTARTTDQADLAEALAQIRSSSIPVILRASRPAPDVASLRLIVFARGEGGDYRCSRSVSISVDLGTLEPVTEPRSSLEFLSLSGAFSRAFADLAGVLDPEAMTAFEPYAEPAACPALDRLAERFLDAYGRHRAAARDDLVGPTGLPPLAWGSLPDPHAPALEFRAIRSGRDAASLRLTLFVREAGARRLVAAYDVATTADILPPCPAPGPEARLASPTGADAAASVPDERAAAAGDEVVAPPPGANADGGGEDATKTAAPATDAPRTDVAAPSVEVVAERPKAEGGAAGESRTAAPGAPPARREDTPARREDTPAERADTPAQREDTPAEREDMPAQGEDTPVRAGLSRSEPVEAVAPAVTAGTPPPVCRETGEILALSVSPAKVWPGDMLTVFATVRGCSPTFFNLSEAGAVTAIPGHIFDTETFQDAVTYELSPGTRFGLRVEEKDPPGRHWLGLFCSSCRTEVDRATLARWLRSSGLPSARSDHAATLDDDVRMAADAYVKAD